MPAVFRASRATGHRRRRAAVTAALCVTLGLAPITLGGSADAGSAATTAGTTRATTTATSAGAGAGGDLASAQARAAQLTNEIQVQGQQLDQLSEQFDAATIRAHALTAELSAVRRQVASTDRQLASTKSALVDQAVAAYLAGGSPLIEYVPDKPGLDPSLTAAYAEIAAEMEHHTLSSYQQLLEEQSTAQASLVTEQRAALAGLRAVTTTASRARAATAYDKQLLAQVTGRVAVLVAADQRQQATVEANAERAELAQDGPLPGASTSPGGGRPASSTTPPTTPPPAPTTGTGPTTGTPPPTGSQPTTVTTSPPTTSPSPPTTTAPGGQPGPQAPGAAAAIAYARAQLGKPYQWGGAGPDSFDCSGLVMMAWEAGGVGFPHLAQDQYDLTEREPISDLLPGDLVFFGTPDDVYHVGLYIGGGEMIDAPETGQDVSIQSIYWSSLLGGGRVTG